MRQGLQNIIDYKGKHSRELPSDTSLPDELNYFYAHFKASNTETCMRASAVLDDCVITLSAADVFKTFKQVNIHKAAGPDGLPGRVLRACAAQLASLFTDIFNLSLYKSVIPTCFKQTTIVPVPQNTKVTCLNDYRPVALTSVDMKCFGMLVMLTSTPLSQKPYTHSNLHTAPTDPKMTPHGPFTPGQGNTYVRMLFIDYSSAFNTIVP